MQLHPFKFQTIFKDKIWGGTKIKTYLNKDFGDLPNCGETWELSGVEGNISKVHGGPFHGTDLTTLIDKFQAELVGERIFEKHGAEFPLLVKFIDANDDLSIQVHPDDSLAQSRHGSLGKTEMWYIIQADEDANLITGFNRELTKANYLDAFSNNALPEILNREQAQADDVFFIPAGRVHTIGKNILLAEIQQTSDVTYRIYDFDRVDWQGRKRELHVEQAVDAIDYSYYAEYKTQYNQQLNHTVNLVTSPYFITNRIYHEQPQNRQYFDLDSFVILICLEGSCQLEFDGGKLQRVTLGDVILVPAAIKQVGIRPEGVIKMLESYPSPFE